MESALHDVVEIEWLAEKWQQAVWVDLSGGYNGI